MIRRSLKNQGLTRADVAAYFDYWAEILGRGSGFPAGTGEARLFGLGQLAGVLCIRIQREVQAYIAHGQTLTWCREQLGPELSELLYGNLSFLPDLRLPVDDVLKRVTAVGALSARSVDTAVWLYSHVLQADLDELDSYRVMWSGIELRARDLLAAHRDSAGRDQALNAVGPVLRRAIHGIGFRVPIVDLQLNPIPVGQFKGRR